MGWNPASWSAPGRGRALLVAAFTAGVLGSVACDRTSQPGAGLAGDGMGGQAGSAAAGQSGAVAGAGVPNDAPEAKSPFECAIELEADAHNCGFSGHDCHGAACTGCACEPTLLTAEFQWGITSFAIDDSSLYFTTPGMGPDAGGDSRDETSGAVLKCPLTGCAGSPSLLASKQWYPQQLRVAASTLYWVDYNASSLMRCGIACQDQATKVYSWGYLDRQGLAANADAVFFSDSRAGLIEYCSASGCVAPTTYASQQATPSEIVLGAESLFWVSYGTYFSGPRKSTGYTSGGVAACPLRGCDGGPTMLAQQQSYPASLALSATTAYWVQGGVILSCAVRGCDRAPATFLSPPDDVAVGGLASDENNLYFAVDDTAYRKIMRCSLDGCAGGPQPLFFEPHISGIDSMQIAVDAARVYFLTNNGERVASVPK